LRYPGGSDVGAALPREVLPLSVQSLDDRREPCRCKLWEQRWRPDMPERCANCGGMFAAHTVEARKPRPGDRA
jgi:hypothetical protein